MSIFRKKPIAKLLAQAADHSGLKRTLTARGLVALGIGAVIGAGLFVRTAAASGEGAAPAVTLSFVFAAIGCAFAGLCYAEFASMIPIAGSAYTYAYATMGELIAWIIGWALILEYALGAATVSIAWSEYINNLIVVFIPFCKAHWPGMADYINHHAAGLFPFRLCHSPFEKSDGIRGIINLPALFILLLLSLLLIKGTQESAV